jgi:hypothetical protein
MRIESVRLACMATIVAIVGGCADNPILQYYDGPTLPPDKIAIIYNDQTSVFIWEINGKETRSGFTSWRGEAGVREIDVLPGDYRLSGEYLFGTGTSHFNILAHCETGKRYRLTAKIIGYNAEITLLEVPASPAS